MTTKITEKNISQLANAGVNWQSVFTGDGSTGLTAVAGRGYFIDTTSGAVTVTLPASPNAGDVVVLKDYARTWGTNAVSLASALFDGVAAQTPSFSTNAQTVTLVYMDGTKGWSLINEDTTTGLGALFISATGGTVTTSGDYKVHAFTGDGCFVVSSLGNPTGDPLGGGNNVDYLVVAGGGGARHNGGGGGAGGFRVSNVQSLPAPTTSPLASPTGITITATTYPITVGAGGSGGSPGGSNGSNSVFSTITSAGGGLSGGQVPDSTGEPGGSGGGGDYNTATRFAGGGNSPPVSPPQGNDGGDGGYPYTPSYSGGGGGGAACGGTPGGSGSYGALNGRGGHGSYIDPAFGGSYGTDGDVKPAPIGARHFSGGGGAAGNPANDAANVYGGEGGGGLGGPSGNNADANTGGGGGGNVPSGSGGAGGKGIVLIRYKFQ